MNVWNVAAFASLTGFFGSMLVRAPIEVVLVSVACSAVLFLIAAVKGD